MSAPVHTAIQSHSRAVRGRDTRRSAASVPRKKTGQIGTAAMRNTAVARRRRNCERRPPEAGAAVELVSR
jgi:hypothetical protein